jgi:two-component system invasion response regulator UvrY
MTEMIRVVIADDDEQIRAQVRKLLQGQTHLQVVAEAATGQEAMSLVKRHLPQLLLLDVEMPGMNGLQALQRIHHDHPQTHVVIVSGRTDRTSVRAAQELGAQGYVAKRDLTDELILAIGDVIAGGSFLSHAVSQEKTVSTTKARETSVEDKQEAKMTKDQHCDTGGLSVSTLSRKQDNTASRETRLIRVLVVDDEPFTVEVLCNMLSKDTQMHLAGACEDVDTAVSLIRQQRPDIVLLDLGLPSLEPERTHERGGWHVVKQLRRADSRVCVILCTRTRKQKDVSEAWRKGIDGYVPKKVVREELMQAIHTVYSGESYFSPSLGERVVRPGRQTGKLKPRQREVFYLFVRDLKTEQIMDEMGIGTEAIHTHMHHIRRQCGHQHGWEGVAKDARKDSDLLDGLGELERKVFDQYVGRWDGRGYVGGMTAPENIAEALRIPVGEVKAIIGEIRYELSPHHPDGWKGIARDEGDID